MVSPPYAVFGVFVAVAAIAVVVRRRPGVRTPPAGNRARSAHRAEIADLPPAYTLDPASYPDVLVGAGHHHHHHHHNHHANMDHTHHMDHAHHAHHVHHVDHTHYVHDSTSTTTMNY
ncbi:hypothetical protein AX15_003268 [Amanita polypyramis BW_CC]|nr:hypothetical protein AX15_003268 [Amanita polypyramis BW_CC]